MVEEESVQLTLTSTTVFTRLEEVQVRAFCSTHEHGVRNVYLPLPRQDYIPMGKPHAIGQGRHQFRRCESRECFLIDIIDNFPDIEETEYFNISIELENDTLQYAQLVDTTGTVFLLPRRMY